MTTTRKALAKKAPAKKPAADDAATPRLKWHFQDGFAERSKTGQVAPFANGELSIKPGSDGKWRATYTRAGKETVLAEGVGAARAYAACVEFSRKGAAA
jgi:hypothetical protein